MAKIYADLVYKNVKTIDNVPAELKVAVQAILNTIAERESDLNAEEAMRQR